MSDLNEMRMQNESSVAANNEPKPKYQAPQIRVMTEQEVLSAFQVTAAGSSMWWG